MQSIDDLVTSDKRPLVIAHRGASFYHHENTMKSFEAAVDMRAEMVELDARRTEDGILVVHHDPDFDKVKIRDMTASQLRERSEAAGCTVPTLAEVLQLCRDTISVDIELKEPGYEEQVIETILGILGPDQFLISSSYDMVILKVKALNPEIRTGLVLFRAPFPVCLRHLFPSARIRLTGTDFVMVSEKLVKLGFLKFNRDLGKPYWIYTVNDRKRLWQFISDERIGAIFTDRPDVALFLRDLYVVNQGEGRRAEGGE